MRYSDTWWLDESALPDLLWACLRVYENGAAEVLDLDGNIHQFDSEQEARFWLLEDEYSSFPNLIKDGDVEPLVQPREAATFESLVERMSRQRHREKP
jgi:hypothetical protein